ncbi:MAG: hypothetical protein JF593_13030 [Novosphingobium sp.]|nr:hypothetical protein [Novosphingobium sp.]
MHHPLRAIHTHALDFWFARTSILVIVALQLLLGDRVALGPVWLAPAIELALLLPLSIATAWAQDLAVRAQTDEHWHFVKRRRRMVRLIAVVLTAAVTILNSAALANVIDALLHGHGANGQRLLADAIKIWTINIFAFALWYWSFDRGGPATRGLTGSPRPDFLFAQMSVPEVATDWSPGFVDYLFLSFTNATAFSPTDTLPLSGRAKVLMMAQSGISLLTIALVAARAVNILS